MMSLSPKGTKGSGVVGLDLQKRDIGVGIGADQLGLKFDAREELDQDLVGPFDHVVVGDDEAVLGNHEARAQRLAAARCGGAACARTCVVETIMAMATSRAIIAAISAR
jgi:hypothetical protein